MITIDPELEPTQPIPRETLAELAAAWRASIEERERTAAPASESEGTVRP